MKLLFGFACGVALLVAAPQASAQSAPDAHADNAIVVEARLSGAPMWEVTRGDSIVLLVGQIVSVPKATPWRPERLQAATERAQSVILGPKPSVAVGDIFRVMLHLGRITKMPKGKSAADYLTPDQLRRLAALESDRGEGYLHASFLLTAHSLLHGRLKFTKDTADDADDVVRRTAGRAHIPVRPVAVVKGRDMITSLFSARPEANVRCLETAMTAVEAGPDQIVARGRAWTQYDVPAVMASPLEIALGSCWPWTDATTGTELRGQWVRQIDAALAGKGVTLAVVPLHVLAEDGGVLDRLKAQDFDIKGPKWRARP